MQADSLWQIQLLGPLTLTRGAQRISQFRTRRAAALLGYLALYADREVLRDTICSAIWPDALPDAGRARLRQELAALRRQCEAPGESLILASRSALQLNPAAAQTDTHRYLSLLSSPHDSAEPNCLSAAARLYQGPLLQGLSDSWLLPERERLFRLQSLTLARLVEQELSLGQEAAACEWAQRALVHDPADETALIRLIRLLDAMGRTAEARHAFEAFATRQPPSEFARGVARALGRNPRRSPVEPAMFLPELPERAPLARLPLPLTRFFGRDNELTWLTQTFTEGTRLVTITGPGGAGKTRLALEAGRQLEAICFVGLASLEDSEHLSNRLVEALELPPAPLPAPLERAVQALSSASTPLLILDNCEHVVDAVASIAHYLLGAVPHLRILATSRQALRLSGERELALAPLETPTAEATAPEQLWSAPSVQLFIDRAQSVRRDFALTERNAPAVGALCRRLSGMPLGLELAASQVGLFSVGQLLERIEASMDTLQSRVRDLPERHRSLRAAIEGSIADLTPETRRFFAQLSFFWGGWSREAAEALGSGALEHLDTLRQRSLLQITEDDIGLRWSMLEPLRDFARTLLPPDEHTEVEANHGLWFVGYARQYSTNPAMLERERDNLRAAAAWALGRSPEQALLLAAALRDFFHIRGPLSEGRALANAALATGESAEPRLRAAVCHCAGYLARLAGDFQDAQQHHEQALSLYRAEKDLAGIATALNNLGVVARVTGDFTSAHVHYAEALELRKRLEDPRAVCASLNNLGVVARATGNYTAARQRLTEALELARTLGQPIAEGAPLLNLGWTELDAGEMAAARGWFAQAVALYKPLGSRVALAEAGEGAGCVRTAEGATEQAIRLWGGADALRNTLGTPLTPADRAELAPRYEAARQAVGAEVYQQLWREGASLTFDTWLAYLQSVLHSE